jgi:hypothetical protein
MRHSHLTFALAALALAGCKQPAKVQVQQTIEETPQMASEVSMGDSKAEPQLAGGFYNIEGGAWRWTARRFTVVLRVPPGSAQRGATLEFNFTIPGVVIEKEKNVALSAAIDGTPLPPETYTLAGPFTYKRDLPTSLLSGESVKIEFSLDKAMPPAGAERRELGVVANSVALHAK